MGEIFNNRLEEINKMKGYSKTKQRALDDLATAYIQHDRSLDDGLHIVNSIKKSLRANGYTAQEIEDYLIEYSYISKTQIRRLFNESIYNEDNSIKKVVECIPAFHTDKTTTDLIIDEIKNRPKLLAALKRGISQQALNKHHGITNAIAVQQFYSKHKDIIELD